MSLRSHSVVVHLTQDPYKVNPLRGIIGRKNPVKYEP
jgi:hypothetical protein